MKLKGAWDFDYSISVVATLSVQQAQELLMGRRKGDDFDRWSSFDAGHLEVVIDYPLQKPVTFKIISSSGNLSIGEFLLKVALKYKGIYKRPAKYGVWGHPLVDLIFEGVKVENGKAELFIGS